MSKRKEQREIKKQSDKIEGDVSLFVSRLERVIIDTIDRVVDDIDFEPDRALEAAQRLQSLSEELENRGIEGVFETVTDLYGEQLEYIADIFERLDKEVTFSDIDKTVVDELIQFRTDYVGDEVAAYVGDVRELIMSSVITGEQPDKDMIHERFTGRLARNIRTELNTSMSGFAQNMTINKAEEVGLTKFIYLGPDDQITRPFCDRHVGKTYTKKEIQELNNGQGLPVVTYGGGYNCRHQWRPISGD